MSGRLRIVGGSWRGRKLEVISHPELRPTPDRVRETLFNWLQPLIQGANCLDLFAGSGALGFEALSRGAKSVDLVEQDQLLASSLQKTKDNLDASQAQIYQAEALKWLNGQHNRYDIVFLDPPFGKGLGQAAVDELIDSQLIRSGSLVYLETEPGLEIDHHHLKEFKHSRAGQVQYRLLKYWQEET